MGLSPVVVALVAAVADLVDVEVFVVFAGFAGFASSAGVAKELAKTGISFCLSFVILFASQKYVTATRAENELISVRAESKPETRCGWFSNPTPANAWLTDKNGEWLFSV